MTHPVRLSELARRIGIAWHGPEDPVIDGAAPLEWATGGQITFAESPQAMARLASCGAAAAVVGRDAPELPLPVLRVDHVRRAFTQLVAYFHPPRVIPPVGISPAAHISPSAELGEGVQVHPGAVIGDQVQIGAGSIIHAHVAILPGCRIGQRVTLFPQVVLYEGTVLGDDVVVHAGAVIGAYGFGYETVEGRHRRSAQLGWVEVEPEVEIGALSTIDRGTYGPTRIGRGTKIDNLVMIAHNCRIGRHNLICSQVGIAGSSSSGDYVVMAGQVGVPDHVRIGDRAVLGAKAGILRDVPEGCTVIGIPATPERQQMVTQAALAKLPEMRRELKALQKRLDALDRSSGEQEAA